MWVLVVHISLNYGYIQYGVPSGRYNVFTLLSFYMFSFYFAAGYFFNNKRDFRELFIRKSRSLVVPWIIYTIFGILVYLIYCYVVNEDIKINFYSIINSWALSTNTPMWFLGSLFFSTMATWFMINWSNRGGVFFIGCPFRRTSPAPSRDRERFCGFAELLENIELWTIKNL